MSKIRPHVRSIISNLLESQEGYHTREDVLRVLEEEAMLMKETQYIIDTLDSDPYEQFVNVKPQITRLKRILRVISCSRIRATNDYCRIDAVVAFQETDNLQLTFRYERKRRKDNDGRITREGFHIRYSIELSVNHQQRENLIVVEVWAANNWPSIQKAVCINQMLQGMNKDDDDDDEDGWEDIEEGNEDDGGGAAVEKETSTDVKESQQTNAKRQKLSGSGEIENDVPATDETDDNKDEPDSYLAYLNPDILFEFLELTGIVTKSADEMNDGTAFFLLMTFPFYEHEWDLVGFLLEEIFGEGEEE
jgi:hypothetical protein